MGRIGGATFHSNADGLTLDEFRYELLKFDDFTGV